MSQEEIITPYVPFQKDVLMKTHDDGKVTYHDPINGEETETNPWDICELFCRTLNRLQALVNIVGDDFYNEFGFLAESFIRDAERQVEEIAMRIKGNIGSIECDLTLRGHTYPYRAERVLNVRVVPKEEEEVSDE